MNFPIYSVCLPEGNLKFPLSLSVYPLVLLQVESLIGQAGSVGTLSHDLRRVASGDGHGNSELSHLQC